MSTIALAAPVALRGHRRGASSYLALAPSGLLLAVFFALPMGMMIGISFLDGKTLVPSLVHYQRFFSDGLSLAGLYRTAVMSLLVAVFVTLLVSVRRTHFWRVDLPKL